MSTSHVPSLLQPTHVVMTSQITLLSADVTVSEISVCSELDINVRMLLSTEQSYIVELQLGVEAFSYPLRYCMPWIQQISCCMVTV